MEKAYYGIRLFFISIVSILIFPCILMICLGWSNTYEEFKEMLLEPYKELRRTYSLWKKS